MSDNITVNCNPANPVDYLACCGIFDLVSRMDPNATAHWQVRPPIAFLLKTAIPERDILDILLATFCNPNCWSWRTMPGSDEVVLIEARFNPPGQPAFCVQLDWWYETLKKEGGIDRKSAWKMYAGQQTAEGTTQKMVEACSQIRQAGVPLSGLAGLMTTYTGMKGRFGFDPRSSRSAMDVGYSPNDLGVPVATYPFVELLATIGVSSFFPHRTSSVPGLQSTRGWELQRKDQQGFSYRLWTEPMPVPLARWTASPEASGPGVIMFSPRGNRDKYSNLTPAVPISITETNHK